MASSLPGPATLPTPPAADFKYVPPAATKLTKKPIRMSAPDQSGTAPAIALPATALSAAAAAAHDASAEPEPDAPPPTAAELVTIAGERAAHREDEAEKARKRVQATRLRALKHASDQLPSGRIVSPRTPKEMAIARCGNVSELISDDSDSDDDETAGG